MRDLQAARWEQVNAHAAMAPFALAIRTFISLVFLTAAYGKVRHGAPFKGSLRLPVAARCNGGTGRVLDSARRAVAGRDTSCWVARIPGLN